MNITCRICKQPGHFTSKCMQQNNKLNFVKPREFVLFVSNLSEDTMESDIQYLFNPFGNLLRVSIPTDKNKRCKGFAFVTFSRMEDAQRAIDTLNGRPFNYLILQVQFSKE